jgi:hypothetical protein
MIAFPLHAKILCTDGPEGELTAIIVHQTRREVTHLVARYREEQRIVPISYVASSDGHTIHLHCSDSEMQSMMPFSEEQFIHQYPEEILHPAYEEYPLGYSPYLTPLVIEHIPEGEIAIHRGEAIEATDGPIGHISELQVAQDGKHITHLVVQTGGLFHRHELSLPSTAIDHITDEGIYLKWDKQMLEQLSNSPQ